MDLLKKIYFSELIYILSHLCVKCSAYGEYRDYAIGT